MSVPDSPTFFVGTYTVPHDYVDFTWVAPSGSLLYYSLYYVPSVGIPGFLFVNPGQTSYRVVSLTYGLTYTFYLTATNSVGESAPTPSTPPFAIIGTPSPPVAVVASSLPGSTTAKVYWQPPSNLLGATITSYVIQVWVGSSVVQTVPTNSNSTNYSVPGLSFGTIYQFAVSAITTGGTTGYSVLSPPFQLTPSVPTAPSNVVATSNPGDNMASLTWSAAVPRGSPITTYVVLVLPDNRRVQTNSASPSATITNLLFNTVYTFQVYAVCAIGQSPYSPVSAPFSLTNAAPQPPTSVVATSAAGSSYATVSWTPGRDDGSPILYYTVRVSPTGDVFSTSDATPSLSMGPLLFHQSYQFQVSATNALGTSAYSAFSSPFFLTPSVPDAPTNLVATSDLDATTAHLTWTAPSDTYGSTITGYLVSITPSVGSSYTVLLPGIATSGNIPDLLFDVVYSFVIQAVSDLGNGAVSAPYAGFSLLGVPLAPFGVVATIPGTTQQIQVFWNPPVSNHGSTLTGYQVQVWAGGQAQTPLYTTGSTATSVLFAYLQYNVAYQFAVSAISNVGAGPFSSTTPATTLVPTVPPFPPTHVQVNVVPGQTHVSVFWNEPTSNGGSPLVNHTLLLTDLTTGQQQIIGPL